MNIHGRHDKYGSLLNTRRLALAAANSAPSPSVIHMPLCRGPVAGPDHPAETFLCASGKPHPKPETEMVDIGGKEGAAARWYRAGQSLEEGKITWVKTEDCPTRFWVSKNYCYVEAAQLDPNFAKAYYRLGTALHAANRRGAATTIVRVSDKDLREIDCFDKAVQLDIKFIEKSKRFCTDKDKVKAWEILKDAHIKRRIDSLGMEIDNLQETNPQRAVALRSAHWDMVLSLLSRDVYLSNEESESAGLMPHGWRRVTEKADLESAGLTPDSLTNIAGYFGALYWNGKEEDNAAYVYANRGTVGLMDGVTDVAQGVGLGMFSPHYIRATDIARRIAQSDIAEKVTFTGHSMGGGLAAAQSVAANREGVTFNAAGLHENTTFGEDEAETFKKLSDSGLVRAYHVNCETLSAVQDSPIAQAAAFVANVAIAYFTGVNPNSPLPKAVGTRIELDVVKNPVKRDGTLVPGENYTATEEAEASGLDLHRMTNVLNSMFKHFVDKCNDPGSGLTVNE